MNPVPSYGGNVCCTGNAVTGGAFDQRKMEARADILVYTSEPLKEGMELSGPIDAYAVCFFRCEGHRFHRQGDRRVPGRDGLQPGRNHTARAISRMAMIKPPAWMEKDKVYKLTLQPHDDEQLLSGRTPHPH